MLTLTHVYCSSFSYIMIIQNKRNIELWKFQLINHEQCLKWRNYYYFYMYLYPTAYFLSALNIPKPKAWLCSPPQGRSGAMPVPPMWAAEEAPLRSVWRTAAWDAEFSAHHDRRTLFLPQLSVGLGNLSVAGLKPVTKLLGPQSLCSNTATKVIK